jgi:hypothetical protein
MAITVQLLLDAKSLIDRVVDRRNSRRAETLQDLELDLGEVFKAQANLFTLWQELKNEARQFRMEAARIGGAPNATKNKDEPALDVEPK